MSDVVTDGLKHDGGKARLDVVPPEIIEAVGAVMTHGADEAIATITWYVQKERVQLDKGKTE